MYYRYLTSDARRRLRISKRLNREKRQPIDFWMRLSNVKQRKRSYKMKMFIEGDEIKMECTENEDMMFVTHSSDWKKVVTVLGVHYERKVFGFRNHHRAACKSIQAITSEEYMCRKLKNALDADTDEFTFI